MSFELARKIADALLYEGYVLYPYRASARKNRMRWQFGVVVPRGLSERGGSEPWAMQTECLVEPGAAPTVDLRVRFLQVQARTLEEAVEEGGFRAVESLDVDGHELVTWEEGVERQLDEPGMPLAQLVDTGRTLPLEVPGGREVEEVKGARGEVRGRVTRQRWPLSAAVSVAVEPGESLLKLRVRIENRGACADGAEGDRNVALRGSLIGVHTLLAVHDGAFVSLLDPPPSARAAAESCANRHTWPVLVGPKGRRDVMLSSPIILYDYPEVAPESPGDLCDGTEIDEILLLRVMTLTEDEKREARATDERARRIIERSESLPPEVFERLHGAIRCLEPSRDESAWRDFFNPESQAPAEEASVQVGSRQVSRGTLVRITPCRRADSMDLFLRGRTARVERVLRDVEDQVYVGVRLEDDPAGELHGWYGRFFYFYPEEIEPLGPDGAAPSPPEGGK
jgi:hypothetical protein